MHVHMCTYFIYTGVSTCICTHSAKCIYHIPKIKQKILYVYETKLLNAFNICRRNICHWWCSVKTYSVNSNILGLIALKIHKTYSFNCGFIEGTWMWVWHRHPTKGIKLNNFKLYEAYSIPFLCLISRTMWFGLKSMFLIGVFT